MSKNHPACNTRKKCWILSLQKTLLFAGRILPRVASYEAGNTIYIYIHSTYIYIYMQKLQQVLPDSINIHKQFSHNQQMH